MKIHNFYTKLCNELYIPKFPFLKYYHEKFYKIFCLPCNVQVISNIIDFDMNIAEAIAAPRTFHGWIPDKLLLQKNTTTSDTKKILEDIGHHVVIHEDIRFGPAMGIWIDPETNILYGACDPRSMDGEAVGY